VIKNILIVKCFWMTSFRTMNFFISNILETLPGLHHVRWLFVVLMCIVALKAQHSVQEQ